MNNKQIACDSCGFYKDEFFINKHKSGKNYCNDCIAMGIKAQAIKKQIDQEKVNAMIKAFLTILPPKKPSKKSKRKKK
jgi:hypothetical protein